MKNESENESSNGRRAEITRRTELAMLDLWIEKYPTEAADKLRKYRARMTNQTAENTLVLRE